jgi:hypothetical protein
MPGVKVYMNSHILGFHIIIILSYIMSLNSLTCGEVHEWASRASDLEPRC